jgi:hypothetical protein
MRPRLSVRPPHTLPVWGNSDEVDDLGLTNYSRLSPPSALTWGTLPNRLRLPKLVHFNPNLPRQDSGAADDVSQSRRWCRRSGVSRIRKRAAQLWVVEKDGVVAAECFHAVHDPSPSECAKPPLRLYACTPQAGGQAGGLAEVENMP